MRNPKVENKYSLTIKDIENFILVDLEKLKTRCWRSNVVDAWCYSKGFGSGYFDMYESDVWIGFYDKEYNGKLINVNCSCGEGMMSYDFNEFYNYKEIENEFDLLSQEAVLEFANWLLDEKVCKRGSV